MAVTAVGGIGLDRAEYARNARISRALALAGDLIIFGVISVVVNSVYGVTQSGPGPGVLFTLGGVSGGGHTMTTAVDWPLLTLIWLLYFTVPEALFGASPGKLWNKLRVVRLDGQPLRLRDVVIRNVARLIDGLPFLYLIGGASVLATRGSQRLGDLVAGTTVVYRHRALDLGATRHATPLGRRALATTLVAIALFTIAFNYFGRPPLVIEGDFNQRTMIGNDVSSYSLGSPAWGYGTVTYPIKLSTRTGGTCTGTIELRWVFIGWTEGSAGYSCSN